MAIHDESPVTDGSAAPATRRRRLPSVGLYVGLTVVTVFLVAAWLLPLPYGPEQTDGSVLLRPPSADHWFGTDALGQDLFTRTVRAARTDLPLAIAGASFSTLIGVVGGLAASTKGRTSELIMRALDGFQALPLLILTVALVVISNNSKIMVVVAVGLAAGPFYIRLVRSQTLALRESRFVEASFASGAGWTWVMRKHVLPNLRAIILTQSALNAALALLMVSALSFLGIGITPPTPSWGSMIRDGAGQLVTGQWWGALFPGLALFLTVLSFNLISDGVRDRATRRRDEGA